MHEYTHNNLSVHFLVIRYKTGIFSLVHKLVSRVKFIILVFGKIFFFMFTQI